MCSNPILVGSRGSSPRLIWQDQRETAQNRSGNGREFNDLGRGDQERTNEHLQSHRKKNRKSLKVTFDRFICLGWKGEEGNAVADPVPEPSGRGRALSNAHEGAEGKGQEALKRRTEVGETSSIKKKKPGQKSRPKKGKRNGVTR